MNSQVLSSSPCLSLLCFLLVILVKIHSSSSDDKEPFCSAPFECGNITAGYPFWGGPRWKPACGHPEFKLDCAGDRDDLTTMMINDVKYRVLDINQEARTLRIARLMLQSFHGDCPEFPDTTYNAEVFNYSGAYENVMLQYGCPPSSVNEPRKSCTVNGVKYEDDFVQVNGVNYGSGGCNASVSVPVPKPLLPQAKASWSDWTEVLKQGFELKWKIGGMACQDCTNSEGNCGFDRTSNGTICYCPHTTQPFFNGPCPTSPAGEGSFFNRRWKISIGIAAGVVGIILIITILLISGSRREHILDKFVIFQNRKVKNNRIVEAFVRNFGSFAPKKYNYSDIKRMTKSFSNKLGQGGYGDVYKGTLPDGHLVAVKFLKGSKDNGDEFMNEVASISRTSHVNIVTLLGFCYEPKKQALIYEFMPNGSLDKFIYNEEPSSINRHLEWKTIYQIAVGIARGLEYLHRGCNTRIVHFDIKPHNILLNEDFCPKISDFGLAKLCKKKESTISMLGTRGTIGYIAPEMFCRNFGDVSHKSDVYSYGMMILEMIGERKNIDARLSHSSEIYFPNWIYKQLEPDKDFEFHGVVTEEEKELAKKMVLVSLWCIQTIPLDRPSMTEVVEMLEGGLECLQVPPKPSFASQIRSPQHVSPISSSSSLSVLTGSTQLLSSDR